MSDDPKARYFTIWAAGNRAFDPGSPLWRSFFENLQAVLRERYGAVTVQRWNREARTQGEVIAVAMDAESRMRLGCRESGICGNF
jgi:hypothetical protein